MTENGLATYGEYSELRIIELHLSLLQLIRKHVEAQTQASSDKKRLDYVLLLESTFLDTSEIMAIINGNKVLPIEYCKDDETNILQEKLNGHDNVQNCKVNLEYDFQVENNGKIFKILNDSIPANPNRRKRLNINKSNKCKEGVSNNARKHRDINVAEGKENNDKHSNQYKTVESDSNSNINDKKMKKKQ